ncbi:MAG: hypothetical protein RIM23_13110 [Coleofasciculus sp. G3-WIS-01]|uniref:hypothetical protein n=1 Tax=Coleofasciculus sp. G3-WIS-01 TaxID=3069528 RepID=UPI0033028A48
MNPNQLPLLTIFNSLRQRHGLPLGVDEYLVVLRSLQAGFGIGTREELEQLCCLVWANGLKALKYGLSRYSRQYGIALG